MIAINSPARISEVATRLRSVGNHWIQPLLRATLAGELATILIPPGGTIPRALLKAPRHPTPVVLVLGGDDVFQAAPGDFPRAAAIFRWARAIVLHGAGGLPEHYDQAVAAARAVRRVVLVETGSAYLKDWMDFRAVNAPKTPTLIVKAMNGPHPTPGWLDAAA